MCITLEQHHTRHRQLSHRELVKNQSNVLHTWWVKNTVKSIAVGCQYGFRCAVRIQQLFGVIFRHVSFEATCAWTLWRDILSWYGTHHNTPQRSTTLHHTPRHTTTHHNTPGLTARRTHDASHPACHTELPMKSIVAGVLEFPKNSVRNADLWPPRTLPVT